MIPVRVPATLTPHIVRDDCILQPDHPQYGQPCPVCDIPLGNENPDGTPALVALVAVGIAPEDRKPAGITTGGAVAVHTACARPAQPAQEQP